jgi:hypothetical protein
VIPLDLGSGVVTSPLPFDVPFAFSTKIPAEVLSIAIQLLKDPPADKACAIAPPDITPSIYRWKRHGVPTETATILIQDELNANQAVRLCVTLGRQPTKTELDAVRSVARTELARHLPDLMRQQVVTDTTLHALQDSLRAAVTAAGTGDWTWTLLGRDRKAVLRNLLSVTRLAAIGRTNAARESAFVRLTAETGSRMGAVASGLARMVGTVQAPRDREHPAAPPPAALPVAEEFVVTAGTDDFRAGIISGALALGPGGVTRGAPQPATSEFRWSAAEIRSAIQNIDQTRNVIAALLRFVMDVEAAQAAQVERGLVQSLRKDLNVLQMDFGDEREILEELARTAAQRDTWLDDQVATISRAVAEAIPLEAAAKADFATRALWYTSADIGVLSAPAINAAAAYAAVNFYLRPINKNRPLRWRTEHHDIGRRFAFSAGLTMTSVAAAEKRQDLVGSFAGVLGGGLRVTDAVRIGAGALVFKRLKPGSSPKSYDLACSPYWSVAFDWDAKAALGKLGDLLSK